MPEEKSITEQDLAALGVIANYIWKPNRLKVRNPDPMLGGVYVPADIVSDGEAYEVASAVSEEGQNQISEIEFLSDQQKAAISAYERDYTTVRDNLEASYRRMYNYFIDQGLIALATIMATAIVNLNLM